MENLLIQVYHEKQLIEILIRELTRRNLDFKQIDDNRVDFSIDIDDLSTVFHIGVMCGMLDELRKRLEK